MPPTNRRATMKPEVVINNVWASTPAEGTTDLLTVPSGQTCRAVRLGMVGIVEAGLLGDADTLTAFVDRKYVKRVRGANGKADHDEIDVGKLLKDPKELGKIVMLVDRAVPHIVVEPVVRQHFADNEDGTTTRIAQGDREPGVIYTDQLSLDDKMFIFNWAVGGTADTERFLEQSNDALAGVGDDRPVSRARKSTSGGKRSR